jgi:hypothetical protein
LRDKKELAKVMYLFENTEQNLKKLQQSIIIQKKNRLQYIEFLEQRVKSLLSENKGLKKYYSMNMNNVDNNNNTNKNLYNNYYSNNNKQNAYINNSENSNYSISSNNNIFKTSNVTDRKSFLKKIEIKKSNEYQNSTKYSPYINRYDENLNNVKNLNAQTVYEQQYSNRQGNNNINVNINDDNSARRTNSFMNNLSTRRSNNSSIEKNYIKQNYGKYRY